MKSVQRKAVLKEMRAEITPFFGISVNDTFFTHLALGGTAIFYPHDSFGIGISGMGFLAHPSTNKHAVVRQGRGAERVRRARHQGLREDGGRPQ